MPYRDPTVWPWTVWLLGLGMSLAGGFINWYSRVRAGNIASFNLIELIGELFTSGAVGIGVFMALESWDQPLGICAALAGVGGHMSTRLLFAVGRVIESRANDLIVKIQEKEKEKEKNG